MIYKKNILKLIKEKNDLLKINSELNSRIEKLLKEIKDLKEEIIRLKEVYKKDKNKLIEENQKLQLIIEELNRKINE